MEENENALPKMKTVDARRHRCSSNSNDIVRVVAR